MESPCFNLCKTSTSSSHLGFYHNLFMSTTRSLFNFLPSPPKSSKLNPNRVVITQKYKANRNNKVLLNGKKENVWSIDNKMEKSMNKEKPKPKRRGGKQVVRRSRSKDGDGPMMVSGSMLMETETVLQTQEPVIKPAWDTFASSVSGIWKGVGAVFSPMTAEMEPIDVGRKNEHLYDCYTLSRIEAVPASLLDHTSLIKRRINWVTLNPYGEMSETQNGSKEEPKFRNASISTKGGAGVLPKFETFDMEASDVMEEDLMGNEDGLVFFEDGSYSRGPVKIPVEEVDESNYYLSPTFKFEQCLVKGCHKRLRVVHTIEFGNGGSDIQIMRVAVYEEQWVGTANLSDESDTETDLKPFCQRKRINAKELIGPWKVFEVSAMPIFGDETTAGEGDGSPYVYFCTETLKKRNFPESWGSFREEEMVDMQDITILWLPGGLTTYVDVNKDGVLCVGVGWYSDEGINLVMERDYGLDGMLKEVRSKTEVKRRWPDQLLE